MSLPHGRFVTERRRRWRDAVRESRARTAVADARTSRTDVGCVCSSGVEQGWKQNILDFQQL